MKMQRAGLAMAVALSFCAVLTPRQGLAASEAGRFQPWVKRGVILQPGFAGTYSTSLVSAPSVVKLKDGRLRMYFWSIGTPRGSAASGNAKAKRHHYIFAAESSAENPFEWKLVKKEPMLGPAPSGNIRDGGPSFPWVVPRDDGPWLMYYGAWGSWAPPGELSNRTGLAVSRDRGITWEVSQEIVLPLGKRGSYDAGLTGSVDVMRTAPERYMMWYTAGERYQQIGTAHRGIVHIGMAHSANGIQWVKYPQPALTARLESVKPFEAVVSKPSVLIINGVYHMWFSVLSMEGVGYRLGYARSSDGLNWQRIADQEIIPLTPGGFDSKNQSYPYVVDRGRQLWMFYTGNSFGETGIGLATLEKDRLSQ